MATGNNKKHKKNSASTQLLDNNNKSTKKPTAITTCMVLFVWITLPILSYNPDLLDPLLTDYFEAWADWAKANVLKLFNFMLWVSYKIGIFQYVLFFNYGDNYLLYQI